MMVHYKKKYGKNGICKTKRIIFVTVALLFIFIGGFTISGILSINSSDISGAVENNWSILTALSLLVKNSPTLKYVGPLIEISALVTSFLGLALAAKEALIELIREIIYFLHRKKNISKKNEMSQLLHIIVLIFFVSSLWAITLKNYSVIDLLGDFLAPLYALFLYILPLFIFIKIAPNDKYRVSNIFVFVIGIALMSSFFISKMF